MTYNTFFKFWRYLLSSTLKIETQLPLKSRYISTELHVILCHKTAIFKKSPPCRAAQSQKDSRRRPTPEGQWTKRYFSACQYHSTIAPYSHFIRLLSALYELSYCQICRNTIHSLEILESHEFDLWQFYIFQSGVSREGCNPVCEYKPI